MKFLVQFFILSFTLIVTVYSQEIYFCESYTENGVPIGPTNKLEIKPWGTALYTLLDNNKQPINDNQLYVFVDKKTEDKFVPYQSKTLTIEKDVTWAVTNFEFKDPGTYNVYFLNSKQNKIASNILKVVFAKGYVTGSSSYAPEYEGECEMVFCDMVINDKPVNTFTTLSLSRTGGRGVIYLNNSVPFHTDKLILKVWRKSEEDGTFNEFIQTKKYKILPEWSDAFIKYRFDRTGEFKFAVFNKEDMLLASSTIVISN